MPTRLIPDRWGNIDARIDKRTVAIAFAQRAYPGAVPNGGYTILDIRTGEQLQVEGRTRARSALTRLLKP